MEIVLAIATVIGGIAGGLYLLEKGRDADWGKEAPDPLPEPKPVSLHTRSPLEPLADIINEQLEDFRIVRPRSIALYDRDSGPVDFLDPWACKGDFFCLGVDNIALFVVNTRSGEYRLVVLREDVEQLITVAERVGKPANMYIKTVEAGTHKVSRAVWKHSDGPKKIHLACDGIEFGTYESAARVFYWEPERGEFREQWVTD